MNWYRVCVVVSLLGSSGLFANFADAQAYEQQVEQLNREAMEAYNNLDINGAGRKLEEALRLTQEGGLAGRVVAMTNLNMGMVYIGGLGDQQGGTSFFLAALCHDMSLQLDPLVSTPEMQAAFGQAQQQAQQGACGGAAAPTAPTTAPMAATTQPVVQPLVHVPPLEAKTQTPLPLYVEVNPGSGAERVYLHYKGLGMDTFKKVSMVSFGQGMAYQVPCNDVWEPKVSYYLEAIGSGGQVVASVGSASVPVEVAVVAVPSQAQPALPGRAAPNSCATGECPPGVECNQPGTLGTGEECTSNAQCEGGLVCGDGDVCRLDGGGGTSVGDWSDDAGGSGDSGGFARAFFQLGFALALPFVTSGMPADRLAPTGRVFVNRQTGEFVPNPQPSQDLVLPFPEEGFFPEQVTEWVPDADSSDGSMEPYEGPCSGDGKATGIAATDSGLLPSQYCVRVDSAGFAPTAALRANAGYFITERIAASLVWRLQFDAGVGSMSNMLIGARGEYLFSDPVPTGMMLSAFGGFTFGQIQAQPGWDGGSKDPPYIKSGLMGLHVGGNLRYRLHRNFGVYFGPELDLQFPDFLFNIDFPIGVEAAFL